MPQEHFPRNVLARISLACHEEIGRVGRIDEDVTSILARKLLSWNLSFTLRVYSTTMAFIGIISQKPFSIALHNLQQEGQALASIERDVIV